MTKLSALKILKVSISIGLVLAYDENCDGEQGNCNTPRRTRRGVPQTPKSCTDGSKTPFQAQNILNNYVGSFQQNSFDQENMRNKSIFVTTANQLIPAMCKNMTVGGSQLIQSLNLSTWIHVQRKPCNDPAVSFNDVPCQNCSKVGRFKVLQQEPDITSKWNCTQKSNKTTSCEGVCIGAIRMREDIMSNYSSKCLSHIIDVQMFNPTTSRPINFDTSQTIMALQMEFDKGNHQYSSSNFKCAIWKTDIKQWNTSLCTLTVVPREHRQNRTLANCTCTNFGPVCIVLDHLNMSSLWPTPSSQSHNYKRVTATVQSAMSTSTQSRRTTSRQSETTAPDQSDATASGQLAPTSRQSDMTVSRKSHSLTTTPSQSVVSASSRSQTNGSSQNTISPNQASGNTGNLYFSIVFFIDDCAAIINTSKKQELVSQSKEKIKKLLAIEESQIAEVKVMCGSIIVKFTLKGLNSSTIDEKTKIFNSITLSKSFVINFLDGTKLVATKSGIGLVPGNLTFVTPTSATMQPTTRERFKLEFDYRPIMFTMAFVILAIGLCVCGSCIIHSYWLKKDKFTKYNSMTTKEYHKKMKAKEEKDRMKEVEEVQMTAIGTSRKVSPSNFDMSNETLPKINERNFTNYHWAQTSFIPPSGQAPVPESPDAPKLMLDDSDTDSDGEENKGYESDGTSSQAVSRAVSHLSLAKDKGKEEGTSDSMSNIVPPLYENIDNEEHFYDSIKEQ